MQRHTQTAEETEEFGGQLARSRPPGNELGVIYLDGELGAGKTTLARGFLRACGVTGTVRSPTYAMIETYELAAVCVLHIDLYRLEDPRQLESLGLRDWAREGWLWLIEWPLRAAERLPPADLSVTLSAGPTEHEIQAVAVSPRGTWWLSRLATVENGPART